jgi:hypothetical protein
MKKRKTLHSFFKPVGSTVNCIESIRIHCLVIYIEKELAASIRTDEIIEACDLAASRRAKFKLIEM